MGDGNVRDTYRDKEAHRLEDVREEARRLVDKLEIARAGPTEEEIETPVEEQGNSQPTTRLERAEDRRIRYPST